ncbi:DUF4097 domain-containing protein [Glycomyces sp. L485]|uniref:DUF4097 family beta strand repeat-containing protein n=1 Tax=Glycomyces sp. L485 TaxID=2909235 RepID=UPI001F4B3F2C|nr:DUF4097 family beta strand repeat-containing protein [Glycomyces sp. L485]MCH7229395.1 DUF4097 domain-containing protein [Glycomyces sp. L485]
MIDTRASTPTTPDPPRSRHKAWWILGGILTGVVLLTGAATAGLLLWTLPSPEKMEFHSEDFQRAVANVDVDVSMGAVNLTSDDDGGFGVHRESTWRGDAPAITEEWVDDDSFAVDAECDTGFPIDFGVDLCSVEYWMSLPSGTAADVRTDLADIRADGLDGEMRLLSSAGTIEAERLRTTETVVENSVGDVSLRFAEVLGDVTVTTSVGNVTIVVPDDGTTYEVRFESSIGEQNIDIATDRAAEADYLIQVSTSVGDLDVRYAS